MTQEAETAAPEVTPQAPHRSTDLLGPAYLATLGIVMTAWIGGLIWAAIEVLKWLMSQNIILEHKMSQLGRLDPRANDHRPERQADLDCIQHAISPANQFVTFSLIKAANGPLTPDKFSSSCCAPPKSATAPPFNHTHIHSNPQAVRADVIPSS